MKPFSHIVVGDAVYVVYNQNHKKKNSPESLVLSEGIVTENKEVTYQYDISDRWEESKYKTVTEHEIKFKVPDIDFSLEFSRNYDSFYDKRGHMLCNVPWHSIRGTQLESIYGGFSLEMFSTIESAKDYVRETCESRKAMCSQKIAEINAQIEEYDKSLQSIQ